MDLLHLLGIHHPIFLAPMAGVSTPELVAEVSNAGGLGALGLGTSSVESARQQILKTKELTEYPFQVNFFCHESTPLDETIATEWISLFKTQFEKYDAEVPNSLNCIYPSFKDNDDFLNLVLETQPKAISFHFGLPHAHQIRALQDAGIITMVTATNLAEAKAIEDAGIDIIIAQGIEAGGHRGIFNENFDAAIFTADLVQLIKQQTQIPIVAAGGVMTGQQATQMFKLGAHAVQLGTAFVQCKTSNANEAYRKALFTQHLTQITASISGRPARGLINHWHQKVDTPTRPQVPSYPYSYDLGKQLHAAASKNADHGYGAFWAGAHVSQIRELEATDLMNQLILEMKVN